MGRSSSEDTLLSLSSSIWLSSTNIPRHALSENICSKLILLTLQSPWAILYHETFGTEQITTTSLSSGSLVVQMVKNLPAMQETCVRSLGQQDPLEEEMVTHSSIFTWRIPWTQELGRLQSMRLHWAMTQREQDWILFFYSQCLAHIWWNEGALPWEESLRSLNVLLLLQTGTRSCALQSPLYWCLHCQGKVKVKLQEQDMLSILFHIKPAPPPMFPLKLIQLNLELATDPRSRYTQARQYLMRWPQLKSSAPPRTKWAN